jgi:hypothetical protein
MPKPEISVGVDDTPGYSKLDVTGWPTQPVFEIRQSVNAADALLQETRKEDGKRAGCEAEYKSSFGGPMRGV